MTTIFMLLLGGIALFLILLVLVQRGRGGGLAGALGGMGGSSAFGAKAADKFTKFTFIIAGTWIVLCILATKLLTSGESRIDVDAGRSEITSSMDDEETDSSTSGTEGTDMGEGDSE